MIEVMLLAGLLQTQGDQQFASQPAERPEYHGQWLVEVVDNIRIMPDSNVTVNIEGTTISGSASCNTFRGTLTVEDGGIRIRQVLKTMKACDPPRMSEEEDFFRLLNDVNEVEVRSNAVLVLRTPDGKTIRARRAAPRSIP
jgi:heat shock protein HslJ